MLNMNMTRRMMGPRMQRLRRAPWPVHMCACPSPQHITTIHHTFLFLFAAAAMVVNHSGLHVLSINTTKLGSSPVSTTASYIVSSKLDLLEQAWCIVTDATALMSSV